MSETPIFKKSSYSGESGCVGVAVVESGVLVCDLKEGTSGSRLAFSVKEWMAFLDDHAMWGHSV